MLLRKPPPWTPGLARPKAEARATFAWRDPRVDALIDTYVEWREECETVETAYEQWIDSEPAEHALAYAAYGAALDREEKAAIVYQLVATRLLGAAPR